MHIEIQLGLSKGQSVILIDGQKVTPARNVLLQTLRAGLPKSRNLRNVPVIETIARSAVLKASER